MNGFLKVDASGYLEFAGELRFQVTVSAVSSTLIQYGRAGDLHHGVAIS